MVRSVKAGLVSVRIRSFKMDDYSRVRTLWKESGLEMRPGDTRPEIRLKLERDPELFLVAEAEGMVVGSVIGAWDGRRGWVYHLGVLPAFQRHGIATMLLNEVERRMKAKGVVKVNASIYKWNKKSLALFDKSGYEVDSETVRVGKYFEKRKPRSR